MTENTATDDKMTGWQLLKLKRQTT